MMRMPVACYIEDDAMSRCTNVRSRFDTYHDCYCKNCPGLEELTIRLYYWNDWSTFQTFT